MIKKLRFLLALLVFCMVHAQDRYLDCDGVNDYVDVPNSGNLLAGSNNMTLSCKVYPKRITSGFPDFDGIAGYRNETSFDFYLIQLATNQVEARFRNSAGAAYTITYNGLAQNQWNHFFLVYNGSTLKLYKGSTEVASVPASGSAPAGNTATLKIGQIVFQTWNWHHMGYLDEVSLWNKALSADDVAAIVDNDGEIADPASESNLKLYYKFNQGIPYGNNAGVNTATDELGLHNGTLLNFALNGTASNWGGAPLANDTFFANAVKAFPNPVRDILTVAGLDAPVEGKIIDMSGRAILAVAVPAETGTIDVSALETGAYLLELGNQAVRFVKR
jgi:hypothetical protein